MNGVFVAIQIEKIAAILRDQAVDNRHLGADLAQADRQGGADEAKAAGDQGSLANPGAEWATAVRR